MKIVLTGKVLLIPDRNKSELTHKVTNAAYNWLDNHGFKPVETEVQMPWLPESKGWTADLAGVIVPTQTELVEMKLLPRPPRWRYGKENPDYEIKRKAWESFYNSLNRFMTCLIEVKTTRGDYCGDRKWRIIPPTDLAFVAVPSGLIKPSEYPETWGVLELRGDLAVKIKDPVPRQATAAEQFEVLYQIALRRDHRTRHAAHREEQKEWRVENGKRVSTDRIRKIIDAMSDIAAGRYKWSDQPVLSVHEALEHHRIKNANERQMTRLAEIFKIPIK